MFRTLPLLVVLVGVATSRRYDNVGATQPIINEAQQRRICADLCRSGLGGKPCGDVCFDLMPTGIPLQSPNGTKQVNAVKNTRSDACPVLCENRLGYPFCQCHPHQHRNSRVDFHKICDYYCQHQKWALRGCPSCMHAAQRQDVFQSMFLQDGAMNNKIAVPGTSFTPAAGREIDWEKWCHEQCANHNGGSACNCDILPFSLY